MSGSLGVTLAHDTMPAVRAPRRIPDPCGDFLPALWYHDLHDRLGHRSARANARWGFVRAPQGSGRVAWIACGADEDSVRLGVALLRAIRERRHDLRLVLTFEVEYPAALAPLAGLDRTGCGYAPADYAGSLLRAWRRLTPFAIVFAGCTPRPRLARLAAALRHCLAVAPGSAASGLVPERCYPAHAETLWPGAPCSAPVDLRAALTPALAEGPYRGLVGADADRHVWWLHAADPREALRFIAQFRGRLKHDVLCVSGPAADAIDRSHEAVLVLDAWTGIPVPGGYIVVIEDEERLPGVATSVHAAHLADAPARVVWAGLSGATALTRAPGTTTPDGVASGTCPLVTEADVVIDRWTELRADPGRRRAEADRVRRAFWEMRRPAQDVLDELLERVFDWN